MQGRKHVIVSGRSKAALESLSRQLSRRSDLLCTQQQIVNGHTDPLYGVDEMPDTLVLRMTPNSVDELVALAQRPANERPPLIVIGDSHDPQAMRFAMQAGARDILSEPVQDMELFAALERIWAEQRDAVAFAPRTRSFAFINAKGGSGATFLATNVAHVFAAVKRQETVIVDLDTQFGTLPHYLDVQPKRGLLEALSVARELDEVAIEAYLTRHSSGLRVLARSSEATGALPEAGVEGFAHMLDMLKARSQRLVFDVPRHLDALCAMVLERVDRIVIVMQQTVPSMRDATRLNEIVRDEIGVPAERISILVNRYRKDTSVELGDIRRLLRDGDPFIVPNHFGPVAESIDSGIPIYDHARSSPVTKAIVDITAQLDGQASTTNRNFIARTFGSFLRT
jgi:pilus assembly protein CpaE